MSILGGQISPPTHQDTKCVVRKADDIQNAEERDSHYREECAASSIHIPRLKNGVCDSRVVVNRGGAKGPGSAAAPSTTPPTEATNDQHMEREEADTRTGSSQANPWQGGHGLKRTNERSIMQHPEESHRTQDEQDYCDHNEHTLVRRCSMQRRGEGYLQILIHHSLLFPARQGTLAALFARRF